MKLKTLKKHAFDGKIREEGDIYETTEQIGSELVRMELVEQTEEAEPAKEDAPKDEITKDVTPNVEPAKEDPKKAEPAKEDAPKVKK